MSHLIFISEYNRADIKIPQNYKPCSGECGSVDWALACEPRGYWFDSQSGHRPGFWARSPAGGAWEATTHWCFSLTWMFLCLFFFLPSPLSKNNIICKHWKGQLESLDMLVKMLRGLIRENWVSWCVMNSMQGVTCWIGHLRNHHVCRLWLLECWLHPTLPILDLQKFLIKRLTC